LIVPLSIAAPAAVAGLKYLDARLGLTYDYRLIGSAFKAQFWLGLKEKKDRLNFFYVLEDHAKGKQANEILLIFGGQQWTYKEVYEIALKYGTWLKTKYNIKPKEIVAMDFMNSEKFIFIWFGIWAIGAKPAFINYNLTGKALAHCIRVSTSRLAFVDPEVADHVTQDVRDELSAVQFEILTPELEADVMSTEGIREPDAVRTDDKSRNMGILIYTSGTTGLPKGAILSWAKIHVGTGFIPPWMGFTKKDVLYTVSWCLRAFSISNTIQCMPMYHTSASLLGFCNALNNGAAFSLGKKFSTKTFWQDCRATNATIIQYVGETCRYLLAAPPQFDPATGENLDLKNSVRIAFGNGLRPDVWNRFKERFGIEAIAEFYAATEGSSGCWNFSRNNFSKGAIGRNGTLGGLLTKAGSALVQVDWETEAPWRDPQTGFCKVVPRGEPGEMLYKLDADDIPKKFQGYFNNKGSTESKIMRNVLVKGDAYFRTGDMLSWDDQGRMYFNDRIGDTFRWKSENVSTNEVSEALGNHAAVHEANVYGVELPHHDGRAGCVAIVLAEEPTEWLLKDLASHAHTRLPRFAVPLFLRLTKNMVITGTNKQQKHVVRSQGVNPEKTGEDELYWLKNGTYVKFRKQDWEALTGGKVRL
jgi:acyl-CoA synthetase (AMP-forming)/AMP-acid ligase II